MTWESSFVTIFASPELCEAFCDGLFICAVSCGLFHFFAGGAMLFWEVIREVFRRKGWIKGGDT